MTYELENHLQIFPKTGHDGIQKAIVSYVDLRGHAVFPNDKARDCYLLPGGVLMRETLRLCLHPVWLSHMSDKLESRFGDDTSRVVVYLNK